MITKLTTRFIARWLLFAVAFAELSMSAQVVTPAVDIARQVSQTISPQPPDIEVPAERSVVTGSNQRLAADAEFGEQQLLRRRASWEPWSVSLDAQYYLTDNVALAPAGALEDWYLRSGLSVRYSNRLVGDWVFEALATDHLYLYDAYSALNFQLSRVQAGIVRHLPWGRDFTVSAHYSWYRVSQNDLTSLAFQDHIGTVGMQKVWKVSRGLQFFAGADADLSLSPQPTAPARHEFNAFGGGRLRLTEKLSLMASYRGARHDYTGIDRADWNHVALVGCAYDLTRRARLSLSVSSTWNRSSVSFFNYDSAVAGAGVSLHLEF